MSERTQTRDNDDGDDELYDSMLSDFGDEEFEDLDGPFALNEKVSLAAKRRRAEQRLEALRLREELGDYDFDFDDDF